MSPKLKKLLETATHEELAETADQIRRLLDNMKEGKCPSCGAIPITYKNDSAHLEESPDCPVARFRPLVRAMLPRVSKR